jgi:hypothetical protein
MKTPGSRLKKIFYLMMILRMIEIRFLIRQCRSMKSFYLLLFLFVICP